MKKHINLKLHGVFKPDDTLGLITEEKNINENMIKK